MGEYKNSVLYLASVCDEPFWNGTLTLSTSWPQLTHCFQHTALSWPAVLLFYLVVPCQLLLGKKTGTRLQYNLLFLIKSAGVTALSALSLVMAIKNSIDENHAKSSHVVLISNLLRLATFISVQSTMLLERFKRKPPSCTLFMFWFLMTITETVWYHQRIMEEQYKDDLTEFVLTSVIFGLIVAVFFICWISEVKSVQVDNVIEATKPVLTASAPSRLLFLWVTRLLFHAWKDRLAKYLSNVLVYNDVGNNKTTGSFSQDRQLRKAGTNDIELEESNNPSKNSTSQPGELKNSDIDQHMNKTLGESNTPKTAEDADTHISFTKILLRSYGCRYVYLLLTHLIADVMVVLQPLLVWLTIRSIEYEFPKWTGIFLSIIFLLANLVKHFTHNYCTYTGRIIGLEVKSTLASAIFRKAILKRCKLTANEIMETSFLEIKKIQETCRFLCSLGGHLVQLAGSITILYYIMGISVSTTICLLFLLVPLQAILTSYMSDLRAKKHKANNRRYRTIIEVLNGIKDLKFNAWEKYLEMRISQLRKGENFLIRKLSFFRSCLALYRWMTPYLVTLATFATFVCLSDDERLGPAVVFVSLMYFNILRVTFCSLTYSISAIYELSRSLKKLNSLIADAGLAICTLESNPTPGNAISFEKACLSWNSTEQSNISNVDLEVAENCLTVVADQSHGNKSSLVLGVFNGNVKLMGGSVHVKGSVAYLSEDPWIFCSSIRENILFGCPYEPTRYEAIVKACAVEFSYLQEGDEIIISEQGKQLNISEKQRVALARAVYCNKDVYIFDKCLSAVDESTQNFILEQLIGVNGYLKDKTTILTTNDVQWLKSAKRLVIINDETVENLDSFDQIKQQLIEKPFERFQETDLFTKVLGPNRDVKHHKLQIGERSTESTIQPGNSAENSEKNNFIDCHKQKGNFQALLEWFQLVKAHKFVVASIFMFLYQAANAGAIVWIWYWVKENAKTYASEEKEKLYLGIYGCFGGSQLILLAITYLLFWITAIEASGKLHDGMVKGVLRSQLRIFTSTGVTHLFKRFVSDVEVLDLWLPVIVIECMNCLLQITGIIVVICIFVPYFTIILFPIGLLLFFIVKLHQHASQEIKKMETMSEYNVASSISEVIEGISVIHSMGQTMRFLSEIQQKTKQSINLRSLLYACYGWLSVATNTLGSILIFAAMMCALMSHNCDSAQVGLVIFCIVEVSNLIGYVIQQATELDQFSLSAKRMFEYFHWSLEGSGRKQEVVCDWPDKGEIQFTNLTVTELLKDICFTIKAGEKIGILGGSGAGKTSVIQALFRLVEATDGELYIDHLNIANIDLHTLRSKISILHKDLFLYSGSLRMNIDPGDEYSDEDILKAAELAGLKELIKSVPNHLCFHVGMGGKNLSAGQKQLVRLARAILQKNKILIVDDRNLTIESSTDQIIQEALRTVFKESTIITVTHRIGTILNYDKVIIMQSGEIKEIGSTKELLNKKTSLLNRLIS